MSNYNPIQQAVVAPEQRSMSKRDYRLIGERRGRVQIRATPESFKGFLGIDLRQFWLTQEGEMRPTKRGVWLHWSEAETLRDALNQILDEEDERGQGHPHDSSSSPESPTRPSLSQQDRALLLLAEGVEPKDLPEFLFNECTPNPRRLIEIGKALRRAGLLVNKEWTLTVLGTARAETLQQRLREKTAALPPNGVGSIPPYHY